MKRSIAATLVACLALVGVAASFVHYLREPYNPGFIRFPTLTAFHVILGGVFLALAPLQFVRSLRLRNPHYHRWVGRLLVTLGLVIGVTALAMGVLFPIAGWTERVYISVFGVLFLVALVAGFVAIRIGRVAQHREWMIRAFAIGLSIATMRLIFIPLTVLMNLGPTDPAFAQGFGLSFMTAFLVNTGVAEYWIRTTRRRNRPQGDAAVARN